jgi:hypothetical protein
MLKRYTEGDLQPIEMLNREFILITKNVISILYKRKWIELQLYLRVNLIINLKMNL